MKEPTAPDAASASAHVFRAWHEVVPAQDADKIADLYAADGVIETPAAVLLSGDMGVWSGPAPRVDPIGEIPHRLNDHSGKARRGGLRTL